MQSRKTWPRLALGAVALMGSLSLGIALANLDPNTFVPTGSAFFDNVDCNQPLASAQNNFEIVYAGNQLANISNVPVLPSGAGASATFDGTNTTVHWSGFGSIAQGALVHFGIGGTTLVG